MAELANLQVVIKADTSDAERGLASLSTKVSSAGSAIQAALGTVMVGAVAGLGAAFVGSVKSAADFEKQMSAIGAVAGASESEMKALTATALQLGKDTSFSASEAAKGIEEMIKAGVSVADVMGGSARAGLDLAAAGAISVADAAEIASNAMNVFGLKGADMAHVADMIAGAANASAIGVNDYKFSLAAAGAIANLVGVSFEDLTTAISLMGQAGIKGSDAGTSLKVMLSNLQPATKAQIKEFTKLGIVTADGANAFFTAEGKAKSMAEIAEILKTNLGSLTQAQKLASLEIMFGQDGYRAAAILMEAGAEGANKMAEAIGKVTAQSVANERLNNLWGSVEKLKGSLETAAIILGGQFTPALKRMADAATEHANTMIDVFEQIPDAIETVKQVLAGEWAPDSSIRPFTLAVGEAAVMLRDTFGPAVTVVAAFVTGTLIPAFQQIAAPLAAFSAGFLGAVGAAGLATAAIAATAAVLGLLLSPLGLVAIAIGLLAAAWTTNFMGIQQATATMWAAVQPVLMALVDWLGVQIPPVLNWISTVGWPAMVAAGQAVSEWVTGTAIPAFTQLVEWLGPKLQEVTTWISGTGWPALVTAGEKVWAVVQEIIKFFQGLYTELEKRGVFTELEQIWIRVEAIGVKLAPAVQKIGDVLAIVFKWVSDLVAAAVLPALVIVFGALETSVTKAGGPIGVVATALDGFVRVVSSGITALEKFLALVGQLQNIKMPSFNLPGFGAPTGGSANPTTLSNTTGANAHVAPYLALINKVANEMAVPAHRLAALMEVEGSGATAVSPANARGLMQVVPGQGYDLPGEDWRDPETSIRQGARALKDKYNRVGSWDEAGRAYFGYGVDAGGMRTDVYGQRYDAASRRYQQTFTPAPPPAPGRAPGQRLPGDMDRIPLSGGPGSTPEQWPGFMNQVNEQLPAYLMSLETIQGRGAETFISVLDAGVAAGGALVTASTDSLGNVTRIYQDASGVIGATITSAAGLIVNTWGAMTAAVPLQTELMAQAALFSVTNLGTGILTTITEASGTTVATITSLTGQVTSQIAQMANGVVLDTANMGMGVLVAATQMHDGTITSVQDMAGNVIVTVTDMAGNVTSQYTAMGAAAQQTASTTTEAIGQITSAAGEVPPAVRAMGDSWKNLPKPNVSAIVSEFNKITDAAKKAQAAASAVGGVKSGGDKDDEGKSPFAKRHSGGPVDAFTPYLVGREGAEELFIPDRPGFVVPGSRASGGGSTVVLNLTVQGTLVHERELPALIAANLGQALRDGLPVG